MLQGQALHVFGFFILADSAPAQNVPAVICRDLVQPGGERPRRVVLVELALQFHENFHGGIFRVFARRHGASTETEDGRRVLPVKLAPCVCVARPGTGNRLRRLRYSRRAHPAWSLRFHRLVRTRVCKYYILQTGGVT